MNQLRATIAPLVIGVACAVAATPANALLQLSADVSGTPFFCADQDLTCDANPTEGILSLGTGGVLLVNGVQVSGSLHTSTKGLLNILNSSSLEVENVSGEARSILVAVGDTDYFGPASTFSASGSGTWESAVGSTIGLSWYNDPFNIQGADSPVDLPGNLVHAFNDVAAGIADSYSTSTGLVPLAFPDPGLFSMTVQFDIDLVSGGSLISRGQTLLKPQQVPEPASLLLLGAALAAAGFMRRKPKE